MFITNIKYLPVGLQLKFVACLESQWPEPDTNPVPLTSGFGIFNHFKEDFDS